MSNDGDLLYMLTDRHNRTNGGCQWGEGITHTFSYTGQGPSNLQHATTHPLLAVFLNPIQDCYNLSSAHLWQGKGKVVVVHGRRERCNILGVACSKFTALKQISLPEPTDVQCIAFGLLCAMTAVQFRIDHLATCQMIHPFLKEHTAFIKWAQNWLNGKHRSTTSALQIVTKLRNVNFHRADIWADTWTATDAVMAVVEAGNYSNRVRTHVAVAASDANLAATIDFIALAEQARLIKGNLMSKVGFWRRGSL